MKLDFNVKCSQRNNIVDAKISVSQTEDGWKLLEYCDNTENWSNKGPHLFKSFCDLRIYLQHREKLLLCKGCRRDVYPAGFQLRWIHALLLVKGKAPDPVNDAVVVFDEELDVNQIVSVEEQEQFYREWWKSVTGKAI